MLALTELSRLSRKNRTAVIGSRENLQNFYNMKDIVINEPTILLQEGNVIEVFKKLVNNQEVPESEISSIKQRFRELAGLNK